MSRIILISSLAALLAGCGTQTAATVQSANQDTWAKASLACADVGIAPGSDAFSQCVASRRFQLAVMNNTEPGASDVATFENDLENHRVQMLVYNSQASDPTAERMVKLARASNIPVLAVTETEPPGKDYQAWLLSELDAVDRALPKQQP